MKSLLDRFLPNTTAFRPGTVSELFALCLARKLNDATAARHYVTLLDTCTRGQLLSAYRRSIGAGDNAEPARRFHAELQRSHGGNGYHDRLGSVISIRIERRTVALAVFQGEQLEHVDTRQLSSI